MKDFPLPFMLIGCLKGINAHEILYNLPAIINPYAFLQKQMEMAAFLCESILKTKHGYMSLYVPEFKSLMPESELRQFVNILSRYHECLPQITHILAIHDYINFNPEVYKQHEAQVRQLRQIFLKILRETYSDARLACFYHEVFNIYREEIKDRKANMYCPMCEYKCYTFIKKECESFPCPYCGCEMFPFS